MSSGTLKIINVTVALLLVLILGGALILVFDYKTSRENAVLLHFSSLWDKVDLLFDSVPDEGLSEETAAQQNRIFDNLRKELRQTKGLRSFILYDQSERVHYVFGKKPEDVHLSYGKDNKQRSDIILSSSSPYDKVFTRAGDNEFVVEAVYTVIDRNTIFRGIRAVLASLLVIAISLAVLLVKLQGKGTPPSAAAETTVPEEEPLPSGTPAASREKRAERERPAKEEVTHKEGASQQADFCSDTLLRPRLDSELKRAAASDQDLVLCFVHCFKCRESIAMGEIHSIASSFFPFQDLLFKIDSNTFAVILPNTDLDQGIDLLTKFQHYLFERVNYSPIDSAVGLSSRNGRLIDNERIITETRVALKKAVHDPETKIFGFRPDPGKYRSYLARKK
ncbi:MAG: hypothetical protein ACLFSA_11100 [Spirochaetaceae bacterium]